jgi:hypothetical protein
MMRKIWDIISRRRIHFLAVGALLVLLGVVSVALGGIALSVSAYFAGMILTGVLIVLSVVLSVFLMLGRHTKKVPPNKVRVALLSALQKDSDPLVRAKAAKGLAELDLEQSVLHHRHDDLDKVLVSTLQHDPDPHVRVAVAVGLTELELEQSSYYHEHNKLDDIIFRANL